MYQQMIKYVRGLVYEEVPVYNWMSVLVCFVDDGKVIMDKGLILTGDVTADYYAHYLHYKNFTIVNGELHYMYPDKIKKINPEKVYLHVRIGTSPNPIDVRFLNYWHLYTTSPNNRFFKSIEFNIDRVKVINEGIVAGVKRVKVSDIKNPIFNNKQVYSENCVMFSGINIRLLEN